MFDKSLSSAENVLFLVNRDNGLNLSLTDVELTAVKAVTDVRNTSAVLRRIKNTEDTVEILYNRLQLDETIVSDHGTVIIALTEDITDPDQIRVALNEQYGYSLDVSDVVVAPVATGNTTTTLTAQPDSLAWLGTLTVLLMQPGQSAMAFGDDSIIHLDDAGTFLTAE